MKMRIPFPLRKYISDEKQITYIRTQNGITIPIQFKFFGVRCFIFKVCQFNACYFAKALEEPVQNLGLSIVCMCLS